MAADITHILLQEQVMKWEKKRARCELSPVIMLDDDLDDALQYFYRLWAELQVPCHSN